MNMVAVRGVEPLTGAYNIFFALMLSRRSKRRFVFAVFCLFIAFRCFFCVLLRGGQAQRRLLKPHWSRNGSPWELWSSKGLNFAGNFKLMPILKSSQLWLLTSAMFLKLFGPNSCLSCAFVRICGPSVLSANARIMVHSISL